MLKLSGLNTALSKIGRCRGRQHQAPDHGRIRERAYELWEQVERPDGRDSEFWQWA